MNRICPCGKEFRKNKPTSKFCSRACFLFSEQNPLLLKNKCQVCKKIFYKQEFSQKKQTCSSECRYQLVGNIRKNKWSLHYKECTVCHYTVSPHYGRGMCKRCYNRNSLIRQRKREARKRYREKYPEKIRESKRKWKQTPYGKQYILLYQRKYFKTEKGKAILNYQKSLRRARSKDSDIETNWLVRLRNKTEICALCKIKMIGDGTMPNGKTLDHIIPLCAEGRHIRVNVRYICRKCNLQRPRDGSDLKISQKIYSFGKNMVPVL